MFIQHVADKQTTKLNPVWLPTTLIDLGK